MPQAEPVRQSEIDAFFGWARNCGGSVGNAVSQALGYPVHWRAVAAEGLSDVELRRRLPSSGAAWCASVRSGSLEWTVALVMDRGPAGALASVRTGDEGDDDLPFDDEARAALQEAAESMGPALVECLRPAAAVPVAIEPSCVRFLEDSSWDDGGDPIGSGDSVAARMAFSVGEFELEGGLLVLPVAAMREVLTELGAAPSPGGSGNDRWGVLVQSNGVRDRVERALGTRSTLDATGMADLAKAWLSGDLAGAVVEVGPEESGHLGVLQGLRENPETARVPLVIVLAEPTADAVVRCGRRGLFAVLPPDFDEGDFESRL